MVINVCRFAYVNLFFCIIIFDNVYSKNIDKELVVYTNYSSTSPFLSKTSQETFSNIFAGNRILDDNESYEL